MSAVSGSIHEECGVFAIYGNKTTDAAIQNYIGLYALQHRGQETCGIVVNDWCVFSIVVMSPKKLIAARDSLGFRPFSPGKLGDSYVAVSKICA